MEIKFTNHPLLKPPTDEEIVLLGEKDLDFNRTPQGP